MRSFFTVILIVIAFSINAQVFDIYSPEIEKVDTVYKKACSKQIVIESTFSVSDASELYLLMISPQNGLLETKVGRVIVRKGKTVLFFKPEKEFWHEYIDEDNYLILSPKTKD